MAFQVKVTAASGGEFTELGGLNLRTRGLFSGREISRLIGFSPTHTISNLRDLESLGLVLRQRAGNTDLYQLNEKNSVVDGVLAPMFDWEGGLLDELVRVFVGGIGDQLVSVRLFGSAARGDEGPDSDIDLLVTVADGSDKESIEGLIADLDLEAGRRMGRPVSSIPVTESEYAEGVKTRKGFWKEIPRESKVLYLRDL